MVSRVTDMAACSNVALKTMYCSTLVPHHHWVVNTSVGPTFLDLQCLDATVSPKKLHRSSLSLFFYVEDTSYKSKRFAVLVA